MSALEPTSTATETAIATATATITTAADISTAAEKKRKVVNAVNTVAKLAESDFMTDLGQRTYPHIMRIAVGKVTTFFEETKELYHTFDYEESDEGMGTSSTGADGTCSAKMLKRIFTRNAICASTNSIKDFASLSEGTLALENENDKLETVSMIVHKCSEALKEHLSVEGLFRRNANEKRKQELLALIRADPSDFDFSTKKEYTAHDIAGVLKAAFLSELPTPLVPAHLDLFLVQAAAMDDTKEKLRIFQLILLQLPRCRRALLRCLLRFLSDVAAQSAKNLMDTANLAIIFVPAIMDVRTDSFKTSGSGMLSSISCTAAVAAAMKDNGEKTRVVEFMTSNCTDVFAVPYDIAQEALEHVTRTQNPVPVKVEAYAEQSSSQYDLERNNQTDIVLQGMWSEFNKFSTDVKKKKKILKAINAHKDLMRAHGRLTPEEDAYNGPETPKKRPADDKDNAPLSSTTYFNSKKRSSVMHSPAKVARRQPPDETTTPRRSTLRKRS